MENRFNIAEILESVDLLISDNKYSERVKSKISNNYKRFTKKSFKMKDDKFEIDSIESVKPNDKKLVKPDEKKSDTPVDDPVNQKKDDTVEIDSIELVKPNEKKSDTPVDDPVNQKKDDTVEIDSIELVKPNEKKSDTQVDDPVTEKIIRDAEESQNNLKNENKISEINNEKVLILKDEFTAADISEEINPNEETYIDEENDLIELENNYIYLNENLKSKNIKQEEKIKDLNILVDKFLSQEKYVDLNKSLKLYQEDNAALRQKIFQLSNKETGLRLQLSDLKLSETIEKDKNKKFEESVVVGSENIKGLNEEISTLKQGNKQLKEELLKIKTEIDTRSQNIEEKINFYREENAKIIIDKSDVQRKLENTKNQLSVNEANKLELKSALNNLNQILSSSNIETGTFANRIEEPKQNVKNEKKEKISKKSLSKLDEGSLDYLVKEIFSK